jgi:hypothetical protein
VKIRPSEIPYPLLIQGAMTSGYSREPGDEKCFLFVNRYGDGKSTLRDGGTDKRRK